MIIVKNIDSEKQQQEILDLAELYNANVFYLKDKVMFNELYKMTLNEKTFDVEIEKLQNTRLKLWLRSQYDTNKYSDIDLAKLIMNNITHLPTCRCAFKQLHLS